VVSRATYGVAPRLLASDSISEMSGSATNMFSRAPTPLLLEGLGKSAGRRSLGAPDSVDVQY